MGRGMLTREVQNEALACLGREISVMELRLMPYIQYAMMNDQRIDIRKISREERDIMSRWRVEGYLEGGAGPMSITREFWDAINHILWFSYVNIE